MPRSDFVIKCIKENKHAKFEEVLNMYRELSDINPGAAGSAFEILVHLFWREAAAKDQKVELALKAEGKEEIAKVEVDCEEFEEKPKSIEEYDEEGVKVVNDTVGYFMPASPQYPVLDSILRFKSADKTEVLAIQISTAAQHKHGPLKPLPKPVLTPIRGTKAFDKPGPLQRTFHGNDNADFGVALALLDRELTAMFHDA
eukprot:s10038_g1.t1